MYQNETPTNPSPDCFVTTAMQIDGYRVAKTFGIVRGIVVRSRSVVGTIGAQLQQIMGGDISLYAELCEHARADAYERMVQHGLQTGANAIIAVRYDATEISPGVTEVLCYGTAVTIVPVDNGARV